MVPINNSSRLLYYHNHKLSKLSTSYVLNLCLIIFSLITKVKLYVMRLANKTDNIILARDHLASVSFSISMF